MAPFRQHTVNSGVFRGPQTPAEELNLDPHYEGQNAGKVWESLNSSWVLGHVPAVEKGL